MNTEERAQPTQDEEWDAFLADLEEIAAQTEGREADCAVDHDFDLPSEDYVQSLIRPGF